MNLFTEAPVAAYPGSCPSGYVGFAFDGSHYYCTKPADSSIVQLSPCLDCPKSIPMCRGYTYLCYDSHRCCFWAAAGNCPCHLFRLDSCLQEVDCIPLCRPVGCMSEITGIACQSCAGVLLVTFGRGITLYHIESGECELLEPPCRGWYSGIVSVCPGYALLVLREGVQSLVLYNEAGYRVAEWPIPTDYIVKAGTACFAEDTYPHLHLRLLATKRGCYPYVLDLPLAPGELTFLPCHCGCPDCGCNHKPCPPPIPSHNACNDVLESVALVEAALAHILNAEGEKIQKAVASTDDIDLLLCVNREVRETLVRATHLEQALFEKVAALQCLEACRCEQHCTPPCRTPKCGRCE